MPLVFYEQENTNRGRVTLIHYMPEQLPAALREQGIEVAEIPEPQEVDGKMAVLYINPTTKEMWYEYADRPLTLEERIQQLERALLELSMAVGGVQ